MKNKSTIPIFILPIIVIGFLTAFDQLTKFMVTSSFALYESHPLINGVFSLTYIRNAGVAWGMFQGKRVLFIILTVIALLFAFKIYYNVSGNRSYIPVRICLILLISGALGNMIDRIRLGYVVDFLDFELISFPVFNVADIMVVVGMILLFILIIFKYGDEEFNEILRIRNNAGNRETVEENEEEQV
ncbi:MAG: signal peptidase II [Clostridium sp.]|nr:signal peptidase II [Clostridium sp.]MCM1398822.1 signal peptidase II [Clostridium sp.]MCM1458546.1 signal peptidase II [Bacteroides sp.]